MKTKIITLALAAAGLAGLASTANAETRVNVSFGVIAHPAPVYAPAPVYTPAPVVVADNCPPTTTVVTAPVSYDYGYARSRGHWENVTTRVWVPERWVASRDRFGRPIRILEKGYFTYRTDRVWVDHNNHGYGYRG